MSKSQTEFRANEGKTFQNSELNKDIDFIIVFGTKGSTSKLRQQRFCTLQNLFQIVFILQNHRIKHTTYNIFIKGVTVLLNIRQTIDLGNYFTP